MGGPVLAVDVELVIGARDAMRLLAARMLEVVDATARVTYAIASRVEGNPAWVAWSAGVESKYYVRGGFGLADAGEVDALAVALLAGTEPDGDTAWMTVRERADVAAALIRGWVEHHPEPAPEVLCWHRPFGVLGVEVGRG